MDVREERGVSHVGCTKKRYSERYIQPIRLSRRLSGGVDHSRPSRPPLRVSFEHIDRGVCLSGAVSASTEHIVASASTRRVWYCRLPDLRRRLQGHRQRRRVELVEDRSWASRLGFSRSRWLPPPHWGLDDKGGSPHRESRHTQRGCRPVDMYATPFERTVWRDVQRSCRGRCFASQTAGGRVCSSQASHCCRCSRGCTSRS